MTLARSAMDETREPVSATPAGRRIADGQDGLDSFGDELTSSLSRAALWLSLP